MGMYLSEKLVTNTPLFRSRLMFIDLIKLYNYLGVIGRPSFRDTLSVAASNVTQVLEVLIVVSA